MQYINTIISYPFKVESAIAKKPPENTLNTADDVKKFKKALFIFASWPWQIDC